MTYLNACPGTMKEIWDSRNPSPVGRPTLDVKRKKTKTGVYEPSNEPDQESS
jgi:hypothetical protein